jgi:hypothetical protein
MLMLMLMLMRRRHLLYHQSYRLLAGRKRASVTRRPENYHPLSWRCYPRDDQKKREINDKALMARPHQQSPTFNRKPNGQVCAPSCNAECTCLFFSAVSMIHKEGNELVGFLCMYTILYFHNTWMRAG